VCRHLAYLGPSRRLDEVVLAPSHSLLRQSYAPADMRGGGTLNADGYGIAWYPPGGTTPVRYRRDCAIWADPGLTTLAHGTSAGAVVAAVRSATVGMPVVETAAAPFTGGRWAFSHNGRLPGWPEAVEPLAARLPVRDLMTLDAPTDSALLWALVRARLHAGEQPAEALAGITGEVVAVDPEARLNLLLCDGEQVAATAWSHALAVLAGDDFVAVCSEPWDDDPRWRQVPDRHLVVARVGDSGADVDIRRLDENSLSPTDGGNGA
jgi:gamma-glutamyl hercynylcysteine S-oxide hydrolase